MVKLCTKQGLLIFLFLFLICFAAPVSAGPESDDRAVMLVIDRLTFEDLDDMPVLREIAAKYSIGLLNTKTGGIRSSENTYATIGASVPMLATGSANMAFNGYEHYMQGYASEEYLGRTGQPASKQAVLQLAIAKIWQQNSTLNRNIVPGALGQTLTDNGLKATVLGNGDFNDEISRPVINIAMNTKGYVEEGNVSKSLTVPDPAFPGGKRTDYDLLFADFKRGIDKTHFSVVDVGDLARLENQKNFVFEDNLARQRILTLQRVDSLLALMAGELHLEKDLLVIVSPTPSDKVVAGGELITPIVVAGKHYRDGGLLVSGTTKRPGIITNTDLAPTVLSFFNIEAPYYMWGRVATVIPGDNSIDGLKTFKNRLALIYSMRSPLIKGYIFMLLVLLLVSMYFIFFRKDGTHFLKPLLILVMCVPLSFLLLPLLPQTSALVIIAELVLVAGFLTVLSYVFGGRWFLGSFLLLSISTSAAIVTDLYLGAYLQKQSILGYDAIAGARFYGLGNEYMGVLLGATIMGAALLITLFPRFKKQLAVITVAFYLLVLYAIAAPSVGTNVGGTLAGAVGFFTSVLLLFNIRLDKRTLLLVPGAAVLVVFAFILVDLQKDVAQQSHIGRSARLILSGGVGEIFNIILRKLEINIKLIRYTIWSRFFLASLASLALLFHRPVGVMKTIRSNYPQVFNGFIATMAAAVTALIFNDSGIVAAATTMIFGVPPFIFLVLHEQSTRGC